MHPAAVAAPGRELATDLRQPPDWNFRVLRRRQADGRRLARFNEREDEQVVSDLGEYVVPVRRKTRADRGAGGGGFRSTRPGDTHVRALVGTIPPDRHEARSTAVQIDAAGVLCEMRAAPSARRSNQCRWASIRWNPDQFGRADEPALLEGRLRRRA